MHGNGIANQNLVDAYNNFLPQATISALGVTEVPEHYPVALGGRVQFSLRGVVGFSYIVLKIMTTLDAELSRSKFAEHAFVTKWKQTHIHCLTMPAGLKERKSRIKRLVQKAGFPKPLHPDRLDILLHQAHLVNL